MALEGRGTEPGGCWPNLRADYVSGAFVATEPSNLQFNPVMRGEDEQIYEFGPFRLEVAERRLWRDDQHVPMPGRVFDILLLLARRGGRLVKKEELLEEVWHDVRVEENNLTVSMSVLRKALGQHPGGRQYIETVPRHGYRLLSEVRRVGREGAGTGTAVPDTAGDAPEKGNVSLAILLFTNVNHDPNLEYFSEGVSEIIINSLSQLPRLKVMARNSVARFKGGEVNVREVGRELGVQAVVEGRVQHIGERLMVSAEMVNVADGRQVWGERYSRRLSDIFLIQEEIAREISTNLRLKLDAEERARLTKRHTESAHAYHLYLRGRHCWNRRTQEGLKQGIDYFQRAIEVDPNYAQAYAGLADGYSLLSSYGVTPLKESIRSIEGAALKAIELDPTLAEAHATLGHLRALRLWDWAEGEKELKLAIKLNPSYANAHLWYAVFLRVMRRFDESLAELRRAQEVDPLSIFIDGTIGAHYYFTRRYDMAIAHLTETLKLEANYWRADFFLGQCYERKGMYKEALTHFGRALDNNDSDPEGLCCYGFTLAKSGNRAGALKVLAQLTSAFQEGRISLPPLALIYLGLGEIDQAYEWLEKAYLERSSWLPALNVVPEFDELRSDRRFIDLLRRIGLPTE